MSTKDRFDLEQDIMNAWTIEDDLEAAMDDEGVSKDDLESIMRVHNIRMVKLFDTFSCLIHDGKIQD